MDRLAPFYERSSLTARKFYSELLCRSSGNQESKHAGHLHVLKKRRLKIARPRARQTVIDTPSILLFPPPRLHRLHGPKEEGVELVCATLEFGAGMSNPLIASLPEPLVLPLDALPEVAPTLQLLFSEAFSELPGRQSAIDRLVEPLLVVSFQPFEACHLSHCRTGITRYSLV
jgi:hypothetical protein